MQTCFKNTSCKLGERLGLGESFLDVLCEKLFGEGFRSCLKLGELKVG